MAETSQRDDKIARSAGRCHALFVELLESLSGNSGNQYHAILDYSQQFEVWAERLQISTLGMRATQGYHIHDAILEMLEKLQIHLRRMLDLDASRQFLISSEARQSWSTGKVVLGTSPGPVLPDDESLAAVEETIENLHELAVTIQSRSSSTTSVRPSDMAHDINDTDNEFILKIGGLLRSRYPRIDESFVKRLKTSVRDRRDWFLAQKDPRNELGLVQQVESRLGSGSDEISPIMPTLSIDQLNVQPGSSSPAKQTEKIEKTEAIPPMSPDHFSTASMEERDHPGIALGSPEALRRDFCGLETKTVGEVINLPEAPQVQVNAEYGCCNWCLRVFRASELREQRWWRQHFITDLKPYVCISEECGEPVPSFPTFQTWFDHMETAHSTRWVYTKGQRWDNYLDEPSSALNSNMRLFIEVYTCPFCLEDINLPWSGSRNMRLQFGVHISRHLLAVAVLSIEYLDSASLAMISGGSSDSQQSSTHVNYQGSEVSLTSSVSFQAKRPQEHGSKTAQDVELETRVASERTRLPTLETLRKHILMSFVESKMDARPFFPASYFEKLITPENIRGTLRAVEDDFEINDIVDFVLNKAKTFFAILVSMGVHPSHALYTLKRYDVTDDNLPISRETANDHCEKAASERSCRHHPAFNVFHSRPWDYITLSTFYEQQWKFMAPVFGKGNKELVLDVKSILPFVEFGSEQSSGAFSEIYKIKIHPDHLGIVDQSGRPNHVLALKAIRDQQTGVQELESWRAFDLDMQAITPLNNLRSTEIVTPVATIARGDWRYMLLPWADGGNLRQFWTETDIPVLSGSLVLEVLQQLYGLSDALRILHQQSWRHGDVKPDNILRFRNQSTIGNLRLGDMGLARKHSFDTKARATATGTRYGTIRYEPPEVLTDFDAPRSRRYDIWSMGCVIFEFVVWLLHGPNGLRDFSKQLTGNDGFPGAFYTMTGESRRERRVKIHDTVKTWLKHLRRHPDWSENTALGELIMAVSSQLLVVDVEKRGTAESLAELLNRIFSRADSDSSYLFPPSARQRQKRVDTPAAPDIDTETNLMLPVPQATVLDVKANEYRYEYRGLRDEDGYSDETSAHWKFIVDNDFAYEFLSSIEESKQSMSAEKAVLCAKCADLDVFTSGIVGSYHISYLEEQAKSQGCDLCGLLYKKCVASGLTFLPEIRLFREGSTLKFHADGAPVLSIVVGPATKSDSTFSSDFQLGWAILPDRESSISLKLMRHWLRNCNENHQCMPIMPQTPLRLPSRLLAIEGDTVRLCQTTGLQSNDLYLALSYFWDPGSGGIVATMNKIAELEAGVPTRTLAPLFQMVISIAQDLHFQYLWIDALCIIQDDLTAWIELQKETETVFSNSHCTLVACSGLENSFLNPRPRRDAIPVKQVNGVPISVCELIDNFQIDVDNSRLSKRGWAFQERALSRRTIFITPTQLYWQCGEEVRCETLTKLFNPTTAILGDPDFPRYSVQRLGRIRTYELLYEQYSRLRFTRWQDRPFGIAALEQRLLRDFETRGAYGIFEIYLARSLLWRRGRDEMTLSKIYFESSLQKIPSWSWMAYAGGINYFDLPFGSIHWANIGWSFNADNVTQYDNPPALEAQGFDFRLDSNDLESVTAIYDRPELLDTLANRVKCVVVGRSRVRDSAKPQARYLLLVSEIEDGRAWERVGVGFVEGESPIFDDEPVPLQIW